MSDSNGTFIAAGFVALKDENAFISKKAEQVSPLNIKY